MGLVSGIAGFYRCSATMPTVPKRKKSKVMADLKRIETDLINKDSGLFEDLVATVRHYTVAFVTLPNSITGSPGPCGVATLVIGDGAHYFLTAAHVWTKLQKFTKIGITLVPNIDQCFAIPTQHLIATGPAKPSAEKEGPDMVLLRIPHAKVGELKARSSFYPLDPIAGKRWLKINCVELRILLGAPREAATLTT